MPRIPVLQLLLFALLFACMLAGSRIMPRASSIPEKEKYYTAVTIGYGEDLTDVVFAYCDSGEYASADDYVREVCEINSLPYVRGEVPELHAGTRIVVPYFE